jgi:hypothetical protein
MSARIKLHPALKHAGYSTTTLLPGEDPAAFEELHQRLTAEHTPNGALEEDTVATMTRFVWRKQNLGTFRIAERARKRWAAIQSEKLPFDYLNELPLRGEKVDPAERSGT